MRTYTVHAGDTLSGIAKHFHTSLRTLEHDNPEIHDPNRIYVGEKVHVPGGTAKKASSKHSTARTYTVHHGDTMSSIASHHGVTLHALEKANPQIANPNRIYVGEKVHIPGKAPAHHAPKPKPKHTSTATTYTVRHGDTMSSIASHHGVTLHALEKANPRIKNPNRIYVGEKVHIPGKAPAHHHAPTPTPTPAPTPAPTHSTNPHDGKHLIHGGDFSHYQSQGTFDSAIKNMQFAAIKATEGTHYVDPTFKHRWAELGSRIKSGKMKLRVAYCFLDKGNGAGQAKHYLDTLGIHGKVPKGTRLALDWEGAALQSPATLHDAANYIHKVTGSWPLVYTSASQVSRAKAAAPHAPLWEAKWGGSLPTGVPLVQYSDGPGYDHDVFEGTLKQLGEFAGGATSKPAPTPAPTPTPAPSHHAYTAPAQNLKVGNHDKAVEQLQKDLVHLGYMTQANMNTGAGIYGPHTEAAVSKLQEHWGIYGNGGKNYGPRTRAALTKALEGKKPSQPSHGKYVEVPSSIRQPRWTPKQAVDYALKQVKHPDENYYEMCDHFAAACYGYGGSGYTSAASHWASIPRSMRHTQGTPPAGALVFWTGGSHGYGHVAVSLGNGKIASTDILRRGKVDVVPLSEIHQKWGLHYAGWAPPYLQASWGTNPNKP